jgi:hypothetical protein
MVSSLQIFESYIYTAYIRGNPVIEMKKRLSVITNWILHPTPGSVFPVWRRVNKISTVALRMPITVAARSKAITVFALSDAGIVGSYPTQGRDLCVCVYSVSNCLMAGWSPIQGVLPNVYRTENLKRGQSPTKGCRAIDTYIHIYIHT